MVKCKISIHAYYSLEDEGNWEERGRKGFPGKLSRISPRNACTKVAKVSNKKPY